MTEPTPLRDRLDDLASSAPDAGLLDLDLVRRRIVHRRRVCHAAYGGAAVLMAATAGVAGALLLTSDGPADPPFVAEPEPVQQAFELRGCGSELTTRGPAPVAPVELTVDLDDSVNLHPGVQDPIGTATITNTSDESISGSSTLSPETWITRDRIVVTEPGPQPAVAEHVSLAPGESKTYDVRSFLRQCVPAEITQPQHEPLAPGRYEVYVKLHLMSVTSTTDRDLGALTLYSGPTTIEVC